MEFDLGVVTAILRHHTNKEVKDFVLADATKHFVECSLVGILAKQLLLG
jgi:hypothetical protein